MSAGVTHLAEVGSTNDWLLERADTLADGHWVIADRQTAGRGRRGRAWRDGAGNLMASVLVTPQPGEGPLQQLSFVAALALHDALLASLHHPQPAHAELVEARSPNPAHAELVEALPSAPPCFDKLSMSGVQDPNTGPIAARLQLKWPNDLLLDGRKVSGILLERAGTPLVIGFGVNIADAPGDVDRPAISLAGAGFPAPSPLALLESLATAFAGRRAAWRASGFAVTRSDWLARAVGLGDRIAVRLGAETLTGRFEGLDPDGALSLRLDDGGLRAVHAGEVFAL